MSSSDIPSRPTSSSVSACGTRRWIVDPVIAAASLKVLDLLESAGDLRERLAANTALFRSRMTEAGFDILPGDHAIAPVMIGDAALLISPSQCHETFGRVIAEAFSARGVDGLVRLGSALFNAAK